MHPTKALCFCWHTDLEGWINSNYAGMIIPLFSVPFAPSVLLMIAYQKDAAAHASDLFNNIVLKNDMFENSAKIYFLATFNIVS